MSDKAGRRLDEWSWRVAAILLVVFSMGIPGCWAGRPFMVRDINTATKDSDPDEMTLFNGYVYFAATEMSVGRELWRCSVSGGSPMLVKDINPGTTSSLPQYLTVSGKNLFFMAYDGVHGQELWKTDGMAAGTRLVKDIDRGGLWSIWNGSPPDPCLTNVRDVLYFVVLDRAGAWGLWRSDGTEGGTYLVKEFSRSTSPFPWLEQDRKPYELINCDGTVFLVAWDQEHGFELWRSDGTPSGTTNIRDILPGTSSSSPSNLFWSSTDKHLYFFASEGSGSALWKTDGTASGTIMLKSVDPAPYAGFGESMVDLGSKILFPGRLGERDDELWTTDGTTSGTFLVKDIRPGIYGSEIRELTAGSGCIYFLAKDQGSAHTVWRSDGTAGGTAQVSPVDAQADYWELASAGTCLYAVKMNSIGGFDLDVYNMTTDQLGFSIDNIFRFSAIYGSVWYSLWPGSMKYLGGKLYLRAADDLHGMELWSSDGTRSGTKLTGDINFGSADSLPRWPAVANNTLYFSASDASSGCELWKTDGTAQGTRRVKDIYPGVGSSQVERITAHKDKVYFQARDPQGGYQLWRSDGTASGTVLVTNGGVSPYGSYPRDITSMGDYVFFGAEDSSGRDCVFYSDGTPSGTTHLSNLNLYTGSPLEVQTLGSGSKIEYYISAVTKAYGSELYRLDFATSSGILVKDIVPGIWDSRLANLTKIGGTLFFIAQSPTGYHSALWRTDGTASGTLNVKDIQVDMDPARKIPYMGNTLFFGSPSEDRKYTSLWKSDGTSSGTLLVNEFEEDGVSELSFFGPIGNSMLFTAPDPELGRELWKTDGTEAGTVLVRDINLGSDYAFGYKEYNYFTEAEGMLYFTATDDRGRGIWRTDGTEKGTVLVYLMDPDGAIYHPGTGELALLKMENLIHFGGSIYFTTSDGTHGYELWALPLQNRASVANDLPALILK